MKVAFYKTSRPGLAGLYNRLIRLWTKSKYSHCELVFGNGISASSSWEDGGVRFARIEYSSDNWDFVDLPPELETQAYEWFVKNQGAKYDLWGNVHFVVSAIGDDKDRWFCSEACGAAIGLPNPWRFDPGTFAAACQALSDQWIRQSGVKTS